MSGPLTLARASARAFALRWRFSILLALLTAGLFAHAAAPRLLIVDLLFLAVILGAALAAEAGRRTLAALVGLALLRLAIRLIDPEAERAALAALDVGAATLIGVMMLALTLSTLFSREIHGVDALSGAAFGFLLLGLVWGLVYVQVELLAPGAFHLLAEGGPMDAQLMYFSLITLTTTGYGDVTAATPAMRLAAALEASFGALYLALLVGRLLGVAFERRLRR